VTLAVAVLLRNSEAFESLPVQPECQCQWQAACSDSDSDRPSPARRDGAEPESESGNCGQ